MSIDSLSYHQTSSSDNRQVDELMIANMLNALNNPHILKMLDDEELKTILQIVKNHVVIKSREAIECQKRYQDMNNVDEDDEYFNMFGKRR